MLPHKFCFLLFDGFSNMVLSSAIEPLRAACDLSSRQIFSWQIASLDGSPVRSSSRMSMNVDIPLARLGTADALVVVSGYGVRDHVKREALAQLHHASRAIPVVGGFDTGAWLLAEAGLLNRRRATIHWMEEEDFAEAFLDVDAVRDPYVVDGNRITCAGADAVFAYTLDLIQAHAGVALRFDVANMFGQIKGPEPARQSARASARTRQSNQSLPPPLHKAIMTMRRFSDTPVHLEQIAASAAVSLRTLERLFQTTLGTSAGRYYRMTRLSRARSLAMDTYLPLSAIATRTGFSSAATLARAYRSNYGVTIGETRQARNRTPRKGSGTG